MCGVGRGRKGERGIVLSVCLEMCVWCWRREGGREGGRKEGRVRGIVSMYYIHVYVHVRPNFPDAQFSQSVKFDISGTYLSTILT